MVDTADVVVIGGGVMGASVAFWLTRMAPGLRVVVVERDPTHARAATALSVASIRQQFSSPVNVRLSRFGIGFLRDIAGWTGQAGGLRDLGLQENGYLFVTGSEAHAQVMAELAAMQRAEGAATQVLTPAAIAARFPWIETADLAAGSYGPRDEGWFDNMGLLAAFRGAARAQGAVFLADEVTGIAVQGGRVEAVDTGQGGRIACGAAVNAAGTQGAAVMAMAGLALPVEPRKRTVFVIDAPNARHPEAPLLIDREFYLRPERNHWITATVPQDDGPCDADDFAPDLHLFEDVIWEQLYARCPGFDAVKVVRHWVGHYDYNTLDQNAILGPHPVLPNLYLCNGFSGHGLQQSPGVGRGLAEHILTGGWQSLDLSELGVARVLEGRPLRERAVV
ncbi:MAG: NAD(P)/FAD-dependent oxidoreductase [Gemmobacter sp.]